MTPRRHHARRPGPAAVLLVTTLLAGGPGIARAAPAPARPREDTATTQARAHFERGQRLYDQARYEEALAAFTAAYEAKPLPDLLFNIGQCHRRLAHHDAALYFYRGYLAQQPEHADRTEVEQLISGEEAARAAQAEAERAAARREELRARGGHDPLAEGPVVVPADAPPAVPLYRRWWLWAALAGVVAAGVTAGVLGALLGNQGLPMDRLGTIDAR